MSLPQTGLNAVATVGSNFLSSSGQTAHLTINMADKIYYPINNLHLNSIQHLLGLKKKTVLFVCLIVNDEIDVQNE